MIDPEILRELLAVGLSRAKQQQVLTIIDKIYAKQEGRLAAQRARTKRYRERTRLSRDTNVTETSRECDTSRARSTYTKGIISNGTNTLSNNNNTNLTELDRLRFAKNQTEKRTARGTRLEMDWKASSEDRRYARDAGFDDVQIDSMEDDFRDYWIAQPGSKGVKLDWAATWRRWIRNAKDRRRPSNVTRLTPRDQKLKINMEMINVVATGNLQDPRTACAAGSQVESLPALAKPTTAPLSNTGETFDGREAYGNGSNYGKLF